MDKPQFGIAYVPADKQFFTVQEVAALLALAQWPEVQGQCVSYPLRANGSDVRGMVLTDEDNAALARIWKGAKLSEPTFPMSLPEWSQYVAAFNRSKNRPEWSLRPCVEDNGYTHAMMRAAAEEQFTGSLQGAIRDGTVSARDPITRMPVRDVRVLTGSHGLLLSRADVEQFASLAMIAISDESGATESVVLWQQRAQYCLQRRREGSKSWNKDAAEKFNVAATTIKKDVARYKRAGLGQE